MTAKNLEIFLCPYVLMSYKTAKNREARWPHDREEPRNYFMSLCSYVFFKPRITRMWQRFDNSIIRDKNRDNRDYHEIYVLMSLCLLDTKAAQKL